MTTTVARVPTHAASRYLQQLCKHWGHKMTVVFSPEEGTIDFPSGARLAMRADSDTLDLALTAPADGDVAQMQGVVERHIDRFAFREGQLTYEWRSSPLPLAGEGQTPQASG